jgi:cytochrome c556
MLKAVLMIGVLTLSCALWAQQDEKDYQDWMKLTGATAGSLRKNLEAKNGEAAAADAAKLQDVFRKVHDFWNKKKIDNATKFATTAQNGFREAGELAKAGKFDEASAALKNAMSTCAGCHNAYREKAADGSWKIKYQ